MGWRVLLTTVALAAFVAVLVAQRRERSLAMRSVVLASVLLLAVAVAVPPQGSRDVWSYASYGRLVTVHKVNPYKVAPSRYPDDPFVRRMAPGWRPYGTVYGPVFTLASAQGMKAAGDSALRARLFFQLLAALAVAAAMALVWRRTRDAGAVAFVGLNPVLAVGVVNGGHNDVLVGLAVLAGVLVAIDDRPAMAGLLLGIGALVKVVVVLPLLAVVAYLLVRRGVRAAVEAGVGGAAVVVAGYSMVGGLAALRPIQDVTTHQSRASVWEALLRWGAIGSARLRASPTTIQQVQMAAALTVGVVALVVVLGRLRDRDPALATAGALVAYLLAAAYVLPWYAGWALPVLALAWRSRLSMLALAHASLLLLAYDDRYTVVAHRTLLHRLLYDLWARALPALEVAAIATLVAVSAVRLARRPRARFGLGIGP